MEPDTVAETADAFLIAHIHGMSVDYIQQAQAAAEAEQHKLMSAGPLAEEMNRNQLLRSIMQTHSTLQRLYHKAVQNVLQRHPQYICSVVGTVYALCCQLLGRPYDKQPGDYVTRAELDGLQAAIMQLPADQVDENLLGYMQSLKLTAVDGWATVGIEVFVVRDLLATLSVSFVDIDSNAKFAGAALGIPGMLTDAAAFALGKMQDATAAMGKQPLQDALLLLCQSAATPNPQAPKSIIHLLAMVGGDGWVCTAPVIAASLYAEQPYSQSVAHRTDKHLGRPILLATAQIWIVPVSR